MTHSQRSRTWFVDGNAVSATTSTQSRVDGYELGIAALAAIELEAEFPGVAVGTRLRRAEAIRSAALLGV